MKGRQAFGSWAEPDRLECHLGFAEAQRRLVQSVRRDQIKFGRQVGCPTTLEMISPTRSPAKERPQPNRGKTGVPIRAIP
jgi:hypothetical protein